MRSSSLVFFSSLFFRLYHRYIFKTRDETYEKMMAAQGGGTEGEKDAGEEDDSDKAGGGAMRGRGGARGRGNDRGAFRGAANRGIGPTAITRGGSRGARGSSTERGG